MLRTIGPVNALGFLPKTKGHKEPPTKVEIDINIFFKKPWE